MSDSTVADPDLLAGRLFFAVPVPGAARAPLEGALPRLGPLLGGARVVPPGGWHLTLAFLGETVDRPAVRTGSNLRHRSDRALGYRRRVTSGASAEPDLAEALELRDELLMACREVLLGVGTHETAALVAHIDTLLDLDDEASPGSQRRPGSARE